jgi:hypothetical protein
MEIRNHLQPEDGGKAIEVEGGAQRAAEKDVEQAEASQPKMSQAVMRAASSRTSMSIARFQTRQHSMVVPTTQPKDMKVAAPRYSKGRNGVCHKDELVLPRAASARPATIGASPATGRRRQ